MLFGLEPELLSAFQSCVVEWTGISWRWERALNPCVLSLLYLRELGFEYDVNRVFNLI